MQLPVLDPDGVVLLNKQDADAWWDQWVARGALCVETERDLVPLEHVVVRLQASGIAEIVVRCEVVRLDPQRVVLRLLDAPPDKPKWPTLADSAADAGAFDDVSFAPVRSNAPVASFDAPADATVVASPPALLPRAITIASAQTAPAPLPTTPMSSSSAFAHAPTPPPGMPPPPPLRSPLFVNATATGTQRVSPIVDAVPVDALPPVYGGEMLRFASDADFAAQRVALEHLGQLMVICDGACPTSPVPVRLAVGNRESKLRVHVTLTPGAPGTAIAQCDPRDGFHAALRDLDAIARAQSQLVSPVRTSTPAPAKQTQPLHGDALRAAGMTAVLPRAVTGTGLPPLAAVTSPPRPFTLPRDGVLHNPATASQILQMPVNRNPTSAELDAPSVPLLLRWLRTTKGVYRAEITATDHPLFTAIFVDGREVRVPASLASLAKSLAQPTMTYSVTELSRAPEMTTKGRTLHLIGEVVRALTQRFDVEALAAAFPVNSGKALRAQQHVVDSVGLPALHARFVKTELNGANTIDKIARAAVGGRAVWETLYVLHLYDGLAWQEPEQTPRAKVTTGRFTPPQALAPDDEAWQQFDGKDHFGVLGLHWSCAPSDIPPAYAKYAREYGPGGDKRPPGEVMAQRIWQRLQEAQRVLTQTEQRRAYRRAHYTLQWPQQAAALIAKAKLEMYRERWQDARAVLEAAMDIHPSVEAEEQLAVVMLALRK